MRKKKLLAIFGVLVGSPICAEYLQAYLSFTGNAASMLFGLLFFAPLYGGAALLIRETAVRTGRGWLGVLFMAGAFGVVMPGIVDLSMLGQQRSDVAHWNDLRLPTLIPALGLSAHPMSIWLLGHVAMSVGTPLALLDALAPSLRGKPLLPSWGTLLLVVLLLLAAGFVHSDGRSLYGYVPSATQVLSVTASAAALVLIAFSPVGRPLPRLHRGWSPGWSLAFAGGFVGLLVCDLAPPTWMGLGFVCAMIILVAATALWFARSRDWGLVQATGLACGAITARTLVGILATVPAGVDATSKYTQNAVFLALVVGICLLAKRSVGRTAGQRLEPVVMPPRISSRAAEHDGA